MDQNRIRLLYQKYKDKTGSPGERQEFRVVLEDPVHAEFLNDLLDEDWNRIKEKDLEEIRIPRYMEILAEIRQSPQQQTLGRLLWARIAIAASLIIALTAGLYFFNKRNSTEPADQMVYKKDIITPGGNKAYLILADGKKISLTDAANGEIAKQAGIQITKTVDGQLVYTVSDVKSLTSNSLYNTIETPRGGQYQVVLPDGSKVWLNAASSLKYPASFVALQERKVELSGEAYFEVAKDRSRPFIVSTSQQEVEVLGTHFNINSYNDEPGTETTLLEGSVKVQTRRETEILQPGQQSILSAKGDLKVVPAGIEEAIAWKNGYFRFNDEKLESIMRKLSRWYNIEVQFEGPPSEEGFNGKISKYKNISQVLSMLEETSAAHFKVDGRRVYVIK